MSIKDRDREESRIIPIQLATHDLRRQCRQHDAGNCLGPERLLHLLDDNGIGKGSKLRIAPHYDGDRDAVEKGGEQTGNERGLKQLGDVLFGRDRIDHEDHGGGNENAECAADRDGAGCQPTVIARLQKLGQSRTAEGGCRGHG
jgi:hypothetical protein